MSIRTRFNPLGTIGRKALLPAGYIELEYLESTGTQWIDTGVKPDALTRWHIKLAQKQSTITQDFGCYDSPKRLYTGKSTNDEYFIWAGDERFYFGIYAPEQIVVDVDIANGTVKANDKTFLFTSKLVPSALNIALYAVRYPTKVDYFSKAKCWYSEIYKGGICVQKLIPALDPTGRPCMFDTVTQQPFYNKGTGEFKWRAKLPKGYTALEYLESTGTQHIFMPRISDLVNVTTEHTYTSINSARSCVEFWQNTIFLGIKATGEFYFANKSNTLFSDGTTATVGTRYKMILNENGLTVNGHLIPGAREVIARPEYVTVGLFSAQNADYQCWLKKYYWIETLSGKMVRCVVPALDASNRPCMYDLVKRKTYYNQGTGEFLYG